MAITVAITALEWIRIMTSLLGQRALGTADRHYSLPRGTEAALAWHAVLDSLK